MDISLAIKTGYFQSLLDIDVPVYDAFAIPVSATYPYVIIANITVRERLPNGCKIYNADVTLDVVTGFDSPTGMDQAWGISEQIYEIINPNNEDIDITELGWNVGETRLVSSVPNQFRTENYWSIS